MSFLFLMSLSLFRLMSLPLLFFVSLSLLFSLSQLLLFFFSSFPFLFRLPMLFFLFQLSSLLFLFQSLYPQLLIHPSFLLLLFMSHSLLFLMSLSFLFLFSFLLGWVSQYELLAIFAEFILGVDVLFRLFRDLLVVMSGCFVSLALLLRTEEICLHRRQFVQFWDDLVMEVLLRLFLFLLLFVAVLVLRFYVSLLFVLFDPIRGKVRLVDFVQVYIGLVSEGTHSKIRE